MELQYIKNDIKRSHGKMICPHNPECRCERLECSHCGWNPKVAEVRNKAMLAEIRRGQGGGADGNL